MTRNQRLPEEILRIIFSKLKRLDVQQCQTVCRSWYHPAHVILLQKIELEFAIEIKRFVNSINHNPNPFYMNAVQEITLGAPNDSLENHDIDEVSKEIFELIKRFPNSKSVIIRGNNYPDPQLQSRDVDLDAIARNCPKLERFDMVAKVNHADYFDLLYKFRHSLTFMRLNNFSEPGKEKYILNFPHLQTIHGATGYFQQFESFLPLVEKLPAIKDITFGHGGDEDGMAEKYLSKKSKRERDALVEKLSKVTTFNTYHKGSPFCVNIATFIMKYFTGLQSLSFTSMSDSRWNDREIHVFNELLQYARTLDKFYFSATELVSERLSMCVESAILMMQTHNSDKLKSTHLEVVLLSKCWAHSNRSMGNLKINMNQDRNTVELHVQIKIYVTVTPQQIIDLFESLSPLDHVGKFKFYVRNLVHCLQKFDSVYDNAFKTIARRLAAVKEVVMDIPTVLGKQLDLDYTSVTSLKLCKIGFETENVVLKDYLNLFPKLEDLQLFYFSGVWQEDLYEFQVNLGSCNLEKLTVDLTPAKRQIKYRNKDAFFVIEVKMFSNSERRIYKTPLNLLNTTEINDADLKGLTLGKDYFVVRVTINTLKRLDIFECIYKATLQFYCNDYYERRESDDIRYVNLFK